MKVKDLIPFVSSKSINIVYENYWTGEKYNWVDENAEIGSISPVNSTTLKLGVLI